jgi:LPXTG-motif cell wall-anchored protein
MGIRRALAGAVLGLAGSVLLALPAAAAAPAPYGPAPTPGSLGTSTTNVGVGGVVVISGNGFAPGTTITINITVVNGFGRIQLDSGPAPMGRLLTAGTTRAASSVQGFAALLTVNADANGAFTASVRLTETGTNVITASGLDPNGNLRTLTTTVFVTGGGNGGNGSGNGSGNGKGDSEALPNTGADLKLPIILGGALVLLGSGAIVAGRKRKQHTGAAA